MGEGGGGCFIVFDIDWMLFEFCFTNFVFSFHVFFAFYAIPTYLEKKIPGGGGGGGGKQNGEGGGGAKKSIFHLEILKSDFPGEGGGVVVSKKYLFLEKQLFLISFHGLCYFQQSKEMLFAKC